MKYANFCDTGRCNINIGDYAQFIAADYLLQLMGVDSEDIIRLGFRDVISYDGEEVIFPFCYSIIDFVRDGKIAISDKIKPVFFAVTLSTIDSFMDTDVFLSDAYNADYLRRYAPVGCRDEITYEMFLKHDIPAYINGCMTAVFPERPYNGSGKVLFVDAPFSLLPHIPADLLDQCEFSTQQYHFESGEIADYKKIFDFVRDKYEHYIRTARMAVTSRLHVALPLTAAGIPVVLAKDCVDGRFSFIERYVPIYGREEYDRINWSPSAPDIREIREVLIRHAHDRIRDNSSRELNDDEKYLTQFFRSRSKSRSYGNSHSVTHTNSDRFDEFAAENWKENEPVRYAFWGVSENNFDFWQRHIQEKYPYAELTAIFDSFRKGSFHGFPCIVPEKIADFGDTTVIVCSVGAAQAARRLFKQIDIAKNRYCIASDSFINEFDIKRKPSFDKKRQVLGKIYPLASPFTVIIDSSEACNFRCSYCFRSGKEDETWGEYAVKKNIMPWDIFTRTVEQLKEFPQEIKSISLSCHGEPLCCRRLPEMVRYIKDAGIKSRISIHTNASLLNREYAEELAESGIDKIVVSLQGLNAETYKRVCGFDISFDEFYDNLKYFYQRKKKETFVNIKIMDVAVGEEEERFYALFAPIADAVFVEKTVPIWKNMGEAPPETMSNKYGEVFRYQQCCPLLFHTLVVTPEGDVYPCTQLLSKEKLGNIKEHSLVEYWNGSKRKGILKRQLLLAPPESCNGCGIKQNSIFAEEDMIDDYRNEILERLEI